MFKEISEFLIETAQPVNKNALLMQVYKVPDELLNYLKFSSIRESEMNAILESDILRYRLIHNKDIQYIFMILKDECFKEKCNCHIEHTIFSGCMTIIVMTREYYTNPSLATIVPFEHNPLLPIIDKILEAVLSSMDTLIENILNSSNNSISILAVATSAIPIITISHILYVFKNTVSKEALSKYLSDPNRKYFKYILNLGKETIDKYILYCNDISVESLLDNAMVSGDLTLMDAYAKILTSSKFNEQSKSDNQN